MISSSAPPFSRWKRVADRVRQPVVVVAAVGTVLGGLAGFVTLFRTMANAPSTAAESASRAKAASALSVPVFPLTNQTGDADRAYLADGLTTALISALSQVTDAVVVPTLQAVALQKKELTLDRLGSEAGVRSVLQGAVAGLADSLRVTTQLLDTRSGRQLWSKAFETSTASLFRVQDELTGRIRVALGSEMGRHAAQEAPHRPDKPQVADLLLRRRALELQPVSASNMRQQEGLARRALAIEPANTQARSALAGTLWNLLKRFPDWAHDRSSERPWLGREQPYEAFLTEKYLPALRLAGLPAK